MALVNTTLKNLLKDDRFKRAHEELDDDEIRHADDMLRSTMDEVRLYHANRFAESVLKLQDIDDATHFRRSVLRRELTSEIGYDGQRDHSAHTVNNYLLGWYIYIHCAPFRAVFQEHSARRSNEKKDAKSRDKYFRNVWMWASLLHDVGYLFEGALSSLSSDLQANHVARGVQHIQDYFDHKVWSEIGFGVEERRILLECGGIQPKKFESTSLAAVADSLRALPSLSKIQKNIWPSVTKKSPAKCKDPGDLAGDCFDLWKQHYDAYGQSRMVDMINQIRQVFEKLVWDGIPGMGLRMLDHGVAGGLLLLQYSTFYFAVVAADTADNCGEDHILKFKKLRERFLQRDGLHYSPSIWWSSVLWGTGATAIHNIIQERKKWEECNIGIPALSLEDDPVAYLGILVDILQEWDRYPVTRGRFLLHGSSKTPTLPLESRRVTLNSNGTDSITLRYPTATGKRIEDELKTCLIEPSNLVALRKTDKR